jgi:hypothetical protein
MRLAILTLSTLLCSACAAVEKPAPAELPVSSTSAPSPRQYTFAWQFIDGSEMAPRGGTSKGTPVTLATAPSPEWLLLQEPGLTAMEKDRRAILAMAGEYRTSFDFIEVAGFTADFKPSKPYQSWGTEKVYVLEDRGDFISLQHILVMQILGPDGVAQPPMAMKHWRQDWQFEPKQLQVYRGYNAWETIGVDAQTSHGAWSQAVSQVDDSPRYAGIASWEHTGNRSTWASDSWRPLPRREYSVRDDYQVLIGSNRHTIVPTGWVHEQQNDKVALSAEHTLRADSPVIAREFGYNRYERIDGFDFSAGTRYLERTAELWHAVREEWTKLAAGPQPLRLRGAPDKDQLFMPMFEYAEKMSVDGQPPAAEFAREGVRSYLRAHGEPAGKSSY